MIVQLFMLVKGFEELASLVVALRPLYQHERCSGRESEEGRG
jgi:hypothetical protein